MPAAGRRPRAVERTATAGIDDTDGFADAVWLGPRVGSVLGDDGKAYNPPFSVLTTSSVLFDEVLVADGPNAAAWTGKADAVDFVREAFKHCKPGLPGQAWSRRVGGRPAGVTILDESRTKLLRLRLGEQSLWTFDPGDDWTRWPCAMTDCHAETLAGPHSVLTVTASPRVPRGRPPSANDGHRTGSTDRPSLHSST